MIKTNTKLHPPNVFLGEKLLILGASNEIAFLDNEQISFRQRLEPRVMEVLQVLLEFPNEVVSREYLIQAVWGDYNGEEGLMQAISKLRRIFQDNPKKPRYIETIPKKGYRLIASVQPTSSLGTNQVRTTEHFQTNLVIQQTGIFTGFIERLTRPRFLLAFLLFSVVLIMVLGILSYMLFWGAVALDRI